MNTIERFMKPPEFPTPPVRYTGHSPIHFCTEALLRSPFYLTQFHDRGALELTPGRIRFTGMQFLVDCPTVTGIIRIRGPFPWFAAALMLVLVALGFAYSASVRTWHEVTPYLALLFVLAWSLRVWRRILVQVDYLDAAGADRRIFFISDPPFGSSRRSTLRLFEELTTKVLPS